MEDPSVKLASTILDRLIDEKLLVPGDRKKLLGKFGGGNVRPEDWLLAIEQGVSQTEPK